MTARGPGPAFRIGTPAHAGVSLWCPFQGRHTTCGRGRSVLAKPVGLCYESSWFRKYGFMSGSAGPPRSSRWASVHVEDDAMFTDDLHEGLTFDDVLLLPARSDFLPRD